MSEPLYSKEELYSMGPQRAFRGDAREAAFLLGGIGTGNVSVGARGELRDWEIFNRPGKGDKLPYSFFAIRVKQDGGQLLARVLESRLSPPFSKSHGFVPGDVAGLPRFEKSSIKGEYPFVTVTFEDSEIPVDVSLKAFTPFIPLNPEDSGLPCGMLKYKVRNRCADYVDVSIVGSLLNAVGFDGFDVWGGVKKDYLTGNVNEARKDGNVSGLNMHSAAFRDSYIRYGSMCLTANEPRVTLKPYWMDGVQDFWDDFCEDGQLDKESFNEAAGNKMSYSGLKVGSLGIPARLAPGEEKEFVFVLSWYFPNRKKGWDEAYTGPGDMPVVKNHYSSLFKTHGTSAHIYSGT